MNQIYKPRNGYAEVPAQPIFNNLRASLARQAKSRIEPSPPCIQPEAAGNELLKNISDPVEMNLLDAMDAVYLDKYENLYEPEDAVRYLYFPESAVISEFQILENGKTVEVSMTGREGLVGISSIFGFHPAQNFSQVLIPGKALRINLNYFRRQLDGCKCFQSKIFNFAGLYISQLSQRVVCNNHHSTEERLCLWLLMIIERCGTTVLPLTQEQIARFLGVHRPSVTLITQTLRSKGIIDYVRGKISIIDREKLENSACACYSAIRN